MFVPPKKWTLLKRKMDVYYDENDSDEEYSEITKVPITDNVYENAIEIYVKFEILWTLRSYG